MRAFALGWLNPTPRGVFCCLRFGREVPVEYLLCFIKGFFKAMISVVLAVTVLFVGINARVMIGAKMDMCSYEEAVQNGEYAECIVVLGASVLPDGTLSPILQNRVKAAANLYFEGAAPVIIMSGDGRAQNYDEPRAMKNYALAMGVPDSAIYCDPGGYTTYDTMWRLANVYGAQTALVVTQEYHLYRAVYDAKGVGMDAQGVVSDEGVYENQGYYSMRECAGRIKDFAMVVTKSMPGNPVEGFGL